MFQLLKNPDLDFMSKKTVLLTLSAVLVLASIVVIVVRGVNPGIEFTGGTELQLQFGEPPDVAVIRAALTEAGYGNHIVTTIGDPADHEIYIKLGTAGEDIGDVAPAVTEALRTRLPEQTFEVRSQTHIGPAIGRELKNKAVGAIVGSLIGMLVYIWIRFQLQWGFAAVVALTHDTLITLGLFSLLDMEMSLPVVAAFLTLVGYSVNDTVVVFDRIRENIKTGQRDTLEKTINLSINQTLARTVITSGLTWIVVFGLFLFGGVALKPFSFVLSTGVIVGTYSSIYIASPILVLWRRLTAARQQAASGGVAGEPRRAKKVPTSSAG